jgi:hypothetical protein
MAFMGVAILFTTSELKVVRAYLVALWLGDIGHLAFTSYGLGWDMSMSPLKWNATTWGNIGMTVSQEQTHLHCRNCLRRVNFSCSSSSPEQLILLGCLAPMTSKLLLQRRTHRIVAITSFENVGIIGNSKFDQITGTN